ncbi:amidohydrolase family protein [Isosphaeraceae bacterium EP7]
MVEEPYIDAHSHIWTPDTAHYPLAEGYAKADMQPPSFTSEELLKTCRPSRVGRVNLIQMSYYGFDNSYMLDMIRLYPDRFVGTAIVDPFGADPAHAMRELATKGVRAFRIQSVGSYVRTGASAAEYAKFPPARWLGHPGYDRMFAEAAKSGLVLSCLVGPDAFPEIDRMAAIHPDAPIILDHLGRIGVDGTIRDRDVDAMLALARYKRTYVKLGAFYALGKKTPPYLDLGPLIRRVVAAFGPERCMWESDCPFQVVDQPYDASIALIRDRLDFLDAEAKAWLLGRTAEALLFKPRRG